MKNLIYIAAALVLVTISCSKSGDNAGFASSENLPTGKGGSLARFAIVGNTLFTVTPNELKTFSISNPHYPAPQTITNLGFGIETIFPMGNILFIGAQDGMHIYDVSNPNNPQKKSQYQHVISCDPVVANQQYAFVTLSNSGTEGRCMRGVNELQIIDIGNLSFPQKVSTYQMVNPQGLAIDTSGNLFVCDDGLKIYNASNVQNLQLKSYFDISAFDIIALNNRLMVIGNDGLYQYAYQNDSINFLSLIPVQK